MAKTVICETCGNEVDALETFTVNGKTECRDCAKPLFCIECGNKIPYKQAVEGLFGRRYCKDCLFPSQAGIRYEDFLHDYEQYCTAVKKERRKVTIMRLMIIGASVLAYALLWLLICFAGNGKTVVMISSFLWIAATFAIVKFVVKQVSLLTKSEFYCEKFPNFIPKVKRNV